MGLPMNPQPTGKASRNGAERKEWTATEDDIIRNSVTMHGCRWRKIAAMLPGRSDDAVRNRWNRLKEELGLGDANATGDEINGPLKPAPTIGSSSAASRGSSEKEKKVGASHAAKESKEGREKPERVSWSKVEDELILASVSELGHKWNRIAERLPGRTDHAIRNRFHRLQSLLEDRQRLQQRSLAPTAPLPISEQGFDGPGLLSDGGFDTPVGGGGHRTPSTV